MVAALTPHRNDILFLWQRGTLSNVCRLWDTNFAATPESSHLKGERPIPRGQVASRMTPDIAKAMMTQDRKVST